MQIPEAGATAAADTRPTGRRERKRRQVRDQLYAAALDLFVSQGYETTTMEQIAETADVARATVFNHYSQKVGFLEEWGARRRARVAEILGSSQLEDLSTGDQLRRYLREMAELNIASRAETTILMDAGARVGSLLHDRSLEIELAKIVEQGRQRGELRTGVAADQVGAMLAASYFSTVLRWIRVEPAPFDLRDRLDGTLDVILLGILAGAGEGAPPGH
ncbi:TetR/AcrR family transcriptional regulator [Streptomyces sp. NBC_00038]|uniref:TetR/AcrR family transcriptional regulator n=1 Tax=Streptomyces sp. NBC_00038 TaxID=2903615 RepID=UPI0022577DB7|nr:TetR/AcrR family transcriptional regulator [Streptomyces sp. NBC_00038]MCX5559259.1 TetR/AcrR family transcriptional regulator [Streptomyces sp. NBC_00038]